MQNNYPTKHDFWKAIFTQPSHKIHVGTAEKSSQECKAIFQDTNINLKLFFIVSPSALLRKCNLLFRNLILHIFDNAILKFL